MDIMHEPASIRLIITLTPNEAQELMDIFDRSIDPSTVLEMLYSALGNVTQMSATTKEGVR